MIHNEKLLEPVDYYENELKDKCSELAEETINKLTEKSNVDVAENRKTIKEYNKTKKELEPLQSTKKLYNVVRTILIILCVVSLFYIYNYYTKLNESEENTTYFIFSIVIAIIVIIFIFLSNKGVNEIKNKIAELQAKCDSLLDKAYSEMYPLNFLINQETILSIAHKTLPDLIILPYTNYAFLTELSNLSTNTGDKPQQLLNIVSNEDTTITSILSGTIDKKMYIYLSYLYFKMETKTYSGSRIFPYKRVYQDDDGKIHTETCYETLTAYITRPYPMYYDYELALYYSSACPTLDFKRNSIGNIITNESALKKAIKKNEKKLTKQEKIALKNGEQFTAMSDVEFETIFNTEYRSNDVEFRMMYTPLAIKNFIKLSKSNIGFKDDYSLIKNGITTTYISNNKNHPDNFIRPSVSSITNYSYDTIVESFRTITEGFFKDIYFTLAPMFMIPIYASSDDVDLKKTKETEAFKTISTLDAENIAYISGDLFRPDNTATNIIHKAQLYKQYDFGTMFNIKSTSFKEVEKHKSVYVHGIHTSGYVDVNYYDYYEESSTNYMLLNYIGLPDGMASSLIKSIDNYNTIKYTYINGFLAIKMYDILDTKNHTILSIINTLRTKKGETNG